MLVFIRKLDKKRVLSYNHNRYEYNLCILFMKINREHVSAAYMPAVIHKAAQK